MKQEQSIKIAVLGPSYEQDFWNMIAGFRFFSQTAYYERCIERCREGELDIVLAYQERKAVGFCLLNWNPKYALFKKCGFPEIQDLNVLPSHRRRGIGAEIIRFCEEFALNKGYSDMGIGVGLDSSFGAAQRLYVRLGYIPDGSGVSYDRIQVASGEFRPVDENLCLMMVRCIK